MARPEPVVSDFTPFNPILPPLPEWTQPTYRQILVTALVCIAVTAAFFLTVHYWR
jgi:hypothetical protein